MERIPEGAVRKSARIRALRCDSQELIARMDAYAVQYKNDLLQRFSYTTMNRTEGIGPAFLIARGSFGDRCLYTQN
jgi:hypothetical protein